MHVPALLELLLLLLLARPEAVSRLPPPPPVVESSASASPPSHGALGAMRGERGGGRGEWGGGRGEGRGERREERGERRGEERRGEGQDRANLRMITEHMQWKHINIQTCHAPTAGGDSPQVHSIVCTTAQHELVVEWVVSACHCPMRMAKQSPHRPFVYTSCVPAPAKQEDKWKWSARGCRMRARCWLAHHASSMHIYLYLYTFRSAQPDLSSLSSPQVIKAPGLLGLQSISRIFAVLAHAWVVALTAHARVSTKLNADPLAAMQQLGEWGSHAAVPVPGSCPPPPPTTVTVTATADVCIF